MIGKNGITIAATEQETGTIMKLSSTTTFFPNTQDRILTISGSEQSVCKAILLIIDKICLPYHSVHSRIAECEETLHFLDDSMNTRYNKATKSDISVKLIVPKSSISSIIGKGGSRIRTIQDTLNCRIHVYNRASGTSERIVVSIGELDSLKKAVIALVLMFQNDTNLKEYASVTYPSTPNSYKHHTTYIDIVNKLELTNTICKISINIPEASVSSVIGPNGSSLDQVIGATGTQIKIFPKDPTTSGSNYRKVTLTGSVAAVHIAHALILMKIGGLNNNNNNNNKDVFSFEDFNDDLRNIRYDCNSSINNSYNYNSPFNNSVGHLGSNSIDHSLNQSISQTTTLSNSLNNFKLSGNEERDPFRFNDSLSSFDITSSREWKWNTL